MKHASLFSGIGGFDLAAEWMGWKNVFHCELNPICQTILKYYWPHAQTYQNIKTTDFSIWRGRVDVLTGGFPCQPYSTAGLRMGKDDERHLWPFMLAAIRQIAPTFIVGENVGGLLSWDEGMVFDEVCADLENEGYEVETYLIPACAIGAPHQRDRIWFIAYSESNKNNRYGQIRLYSKLAGASCQRIAPYPNRKHVEGCRKEGDNNQERNDQRRWKGNEFTTNVLNFWQNFPSEHPVCRGNDGLSERLDAITFSKWRAESLKAYGNAVVPQLVYEIFKAIENFQKKDDKNIIE
jgi:DNA (cytosine-5)-methyltransferase 1